MKWVGMEERCWRSSKNEKITLGNKLQPQKIAYLEVEEIILKHFLLKKNLSISALAIILFISPSPLSVYNLTNAVDSCLTLTCLSSLITKMLLIIQQAGQVLFFLGSLPKRITISFNSLEILTFGQWEERERSGVLRAGDINSKVYKGQVKRLVL